MKKNLHQNPVDTKLYPSIISTVIKDKAKVSSQIIPCLLFTWCEVKAWSANVPPTVDGKHRCRPVRREPDAVFFRVGEMPLVSEFHCIGVPLCTQPWESGVGKPERAACQGLELWFQCIKELVKDRVDAIVSRPGRGGEADCKSNFWALLT